MIFTSTAQTFADVATSMNLKDHPYSQRIATTKIAHYLPQISSYEDALAVVAKTTFFPQRAAEYPVYDRDLAPVESARMTRTNAGGAIAFRSAAPDSLSNDFRHAERMEGNFIYLGYLFHAYGHFMSECISRLWPVLEAAPGNFRFVYHYTGPLHSVANGPLNMLHESHFIEHLEAIGVGAEKIVIVNRPMRFEKLIVPDQAIMFRDAGSPIQRQIWLKIQRVFAQKSRIGRSPEKLYLSRGGLTKMTAGRALVNESDVEDTFARAGFEILRPHEFSRECDKIATIAQARVVAGASGSGLHNTGYMAQSAKVLQLISIFRSQGMPFQHLIDHISGNSLYNHYTNFKGEEEGSWKINTDILADELKAIL